MSTIFSTGKKIVSGILHLPLIAGQIMVGTICVFPLYMVCMVCKNIENVKESIKRYNENKELVRKNPDHCVPISRAIVPIPKENPCVKNTIYIFENNIFERANKHILLRTGELVYLTEKSQRILPINAK